MQALACANCGAPLPAPEGPSVLTCTYCDFSHSPLAEPAAPEDPNATFQVGDLAAVRWGHRWWPARVERVVAPDLWKIHYEGWSTEWDELVGPDRIRPRDGTTMGPSRSGSGLLALLTAAGIVAIVGLGAVAAFVGLGNPGADTGEDSAARAPITPSGVEIPEGLVLPVGAAIEVEWNNSWYAATVTAEHADGSIGVTYTGWSSSFDETVDAQRVRLPQQTVRQARGPVTPSGTPLTSITAPDGTEVHPGDVLEVQWQGAVYRAVALSGLDNEGQVRVHYAGWEDRWDEAVTADRIRLVEP